jgi:hypothetical protein
MRIKLDTKTNKTIFYIFELKDAIEKQNFTKG